MIGDVCKASDRTIRSALSVLADLDLQPTSLSRSCGVYPMRYSASMLEVRQTTTYSEWFAALRDRATQVRIDIRIRRLSLGNPGDV